MRVFFVVATLALLTYVTACAVSYGSGPATITVTSPVTVTTDPEGTTVKKDVSP